jgi:exonuclease III
VKLITWNVAGRAKLLDRQAAALERAEPDLVCLQEVRATTLPRWRAHLERIGLHEIADSSAYIGERRYFVVTASRWPGLELTPIGAPYPERILSLLLDSPHGPLELHNAHIPPAPGHGLLKIETLEALATALARPAEAGRHRILCGDLNVPALETGEGEIVTFAERNAARYPEQVERWDAAERAPFTALAEWDLRDCFRALHGFERRDVSWVLHTRSRRRAGLRLDHVLASESLGVVHCDYHHEWREAGLSDHSAMEAVFEPRSQASGN